MTKSEDVAGASRSLMRYVNGSDGLDSLKTPSNFPERQDMKRNVGAKNEK